jgi:hypothetical protein
MGSRIWRRLPGDTGTRAVSATMLVRVTMAPLLLLLLFVVLGAAAPHHPIDGVMVE